METETFVTPSGESVQIRGLTGYETLLSQKLRRDPVALNVFALSAAMGISEAEATVWLKTRLAGDFMAVSERVQALSGVGDDARKSGVPAAGDGSVAGVSLLPGGAAEDDGDSPAR